MSDTTSPPTRVQPTAESAGPAKKDKGRWLRRQAGALVGGYMGFVDAATWWREEGRGHVAAALRGDEPAILAFWHGRILLAQHGWPRRAAQRRCQVLISQSKDGDVIATAAETLGLATVRGSTAKGIVDKGGTAALRQLLKHHRAGDTAAVTPDGPKGPRQRATLGLIQLAKLTGAPIVPMTWSTRFGWRMNSWDRFLLPAPFGPGVFLWGAPHRVAREADEAAMEAARRGLEAALNALTAEADQRMGRAPVAPAEERPG